MDLKITKLFFLLSSILLFVSCFYGTDFDQANDVVVTPEIELDLIYFHLDASSFYNNANNTEVLVVEDTTDLDFLGGSDINDILKGAVQGISDIIMKPGYVNVDFADVKTVMSEKGIAMMGTSQYLFLTLQSSHQQNQH
mgnify:CR=1 FL=1